MVDVIYPRREGYRQGQTDPLQWSLRTIWHHLEYARVWIVGDYPRWGNRKHLRWIPSLQPNARGWKQSNRWENQRANIAAVLDHNGVSDDILWMNDDYFALSDVADVPVCADGTLRQKIASNELDGSRYEQGLAACYQLLRSWGYPDPANCEIHMPLPVHRPRLEVIIDRVKAEAPDFEWAFFRSLYGAGLTVTITPDPKVYDPGAELGPGPWVSTSPAVWDHGVVGETIRRRYWRPSPYET